MKKIKLEEIIKNTIIDTLNPKLQNPGQALGIANRMIEKDWYVKSAMLEFGKQLLELAAENAKIESIFDDNGEVNEISGHIFKPHPYNKRLDENIYVNKQSITNTIKQIQ